MNHLTKAFKGSSFLLFFSDCYCLDLIGLFFPPVCFLTPLFYILLFLLVLLSPVFFCPTSIPVSVQCFPCGELTQSC